MVDYTINLALKTDLLKILNLQKAAYISEAEIYNDFTIPPLHQTINELEKEFENQVFLKAEHQENLVGSIRAFESNGICYIGKLIVNPFHQNQGLGSKLLKAVESKFPTIISYELFTGAKSEKNLYMYKKYGYQISNHKNLSDSLTMVFLQKNNQKA